MVSKQVVGVIASLLCISFILGGCGNMDTKPSSAEKFPAKPITVIVPFSAGGGADILARAMEKMAEKYLGQKLVVSNNPGGGGTIGWNELASAKPDGYTVGMIGTELLMQPLYGPVKYNYPTAIDPIVQIGVSSVVLLVQSDSQWNSLDDIVKYAKEHPGDLKYSHGGLGSINNVVGEVFATAAGIKIEQVPFRGSSEAIAAFLGGHVPIVITTAPVAKEYVMSGKAKALAVADEQRLTDTEYKNVPTFKEQGFDIVFNLWQGVGAPKGLSADVKNKLGDGFKQIINDPDYKEYLAKTGVKLEYLGPQECSAKWVTENERVTKAIKDTGIAELIAAQKK